MYDKDEIEGLTVRYPALADSEDSVRAALALFENGFRGGGRLFVCDAEKVFGISDSYGAGTRLSADTESKLARAGEAAGYGHLLADSVVQALPIFVLSSNGASAVTSGIDDSTGGAVLAQQVLMHGQPEDTLLAISATGDSDSVVMAALTAGALGMKTVALTGIEGGKLAWVADICVRTPGQSSEEAAEYLRCVIAAWRLELDEIFFGPAVSDMSA